MKLKWFTSLKKFSEGVIASDSEAICNSRISEIASTVRNDAMVKKYL